MKKLINKLILLFNLVLVVALGISYLAGLVSPEKSWIPGIFGLFYPIFLILNLLFIIYWILVRKKYFIISCFIILLGFGHLQNFFSYHPSKNSSDSNTFKLVTYNTRLFDIYKWLKKEDTSQKIIDQIQSEEANIICLQEFVTESNGILSEKNLKNTIGKDKFSHIVYVFNSRNKGQKHGIATYSSFPIINKGEIRYENSSNLTIFTDLKAFGDTIRIYNNHLQSIRFRQDELDLFINNENNEKTSLNSIYGILKKIKSANSKRAGQADILSSHISDSPYPVIICGDFNDTPYSYTYKTVKGDLEDAFNNSGRGFGSTYKKNFLSFRIDYILYDTAFKGLKFRTNKAKLSDHRLISCGIAMNQD